MSGTGADLLVVGVDGLDYDLVLQLKDQLPTLAALVEESQPHSSVFPPDSVPSWTTIVTGLKTTEHAQMSNVKYFLEDAEESVVDANVNQYSERCFWEDCRGDDIAVINPFLAYPPWSPRGTGAMVSGPPFAERPPEVRDPRGLLVGVPPRMGGFTRIPRRRELESFCSETLDVGRQQWDYALAQLRARRWDLLFVTSLVVDRLEHYTWRYMNRDGVGDLSDVILRAHEDLERFLVAALGEQGDGQRLVLVSDHGHGPRANIGVNLHEYLRRQGLYRVTSSSSTWKKRTIEFAKTLVYSVAPRLRLEDAAISIARRLPAKRALKSGSYVGTPSDGSVVIPDLAGSNPFGGIHLPPGTDPDPIVASLLGLRHQGRPVFRWIRTKQEVLGTSDPDQVYPDLLFEMEPTYGPTWNLYGPIFSPIITRKRQSGGHTRRSVYAEWPANNALRPADSVEVNACLRALLSQHTKTPGA